MKPTIFLFFFLCIFTVSHVHATAQTVAAARTIRSKSIINASDLMILAKSVPGSFQEPGQVAGMEARSILYPGRPIRPADIGRPAVVERNQVVSIIYTKGALVISADGRALGRGGIGDTIRVMNLSSRATISGVVTGPGLIKVNR